MYYSKVIVLLPHLPAGPQYLNYEHKRKKETFSNTKQFNKAEGIKREGKRSDVQTLSYLHTQGIVHVLATSRLFKKKKQSLCSLIPLAGL